MPVQESRTAQLNVVIEPKLLFLAKLAARHEGQTLVEFIEDAFTRALSPAVIQEDGPNGSGPDAPSQPTPLWMEGLWVDTGKPKQDAIARLFMVGTADVSLLAPKLRALFHHIITELVKQDKSVTLANFVGFIDYSESGE